MRDTNDMTPAEILSMAERWTLGTDELPERATAAALVGIGRHLDTLLGLLTPDFPAAETDRAVALVEAELVAVRGELTRVDAKCGVLTGLGGAALAILAATAGTSTAAGPVRVLLAAAGVALAAAVVLAGRALRPRFGGSGFCRWAEASAQEVAGHMTVEAASPLMHAAGELVVLSRIAHTKFRALRWASDLLTAGLVLIGAAVVAGVIA